MFGSYDIPLNFSSQYNYVSFVYCNYSIIIFSHACPYYCSAISFPCLPARLLVEEAGGVLCCPDGSRMDLVGRSFLAVASKKLADTISATVRGTPSTGAKAGKKGTKKKVAKSNSKKGAKKVAKK